MTAKKKDHKLDDESMSGLSRREFVALCLAAGLAAFAKSAPTIELPVIENDVDIKTPDGTCDAVFFHPSKGSHPNSHKH